MDSLADYYEREDNIQESVKNAISYPLIMIFMMLVIVTVLVVKVLPIFEQVFAQLGTGMSGFSQSLLNLGPGWFNIHSLTRSSEQVRGGG